MDHWKSLNEEIIRRIKKPLSHPEFILYFIFIITLTGMIGVFTTVEAEIKLSVFSYRNLMISISTYSVALISSATADLILTKQETSERSLKLIGISSILLVLGLFWFGLSFLNGPFLLIPAIVGLILTLFIWWIANADNKNLTNDINPENAIPSPTTPILGDTANFNI